MRVWVRSLEPTLKNKTQTWWHGNLVPERWTVASPMFSGPPDRLICLGCKCESLLQENKARQGGTVSVTSLCSDETVWTISGRKGLTSAWSVPITEESQGRNSRQRLEGSNWSRGHGGTTAYWLAPHCLVNVLSSVTRTAHPEVAPSTVGLHTPIIIPKDASQICPQAHAMEANPELRSL